MAAPCCPQQSEVGTANLKHAHLALSDASAVEGGGAFDHAVAGCQRAQQDFGHAKETSALWFTGPEHFSSIDAHHAGEGVDPALTTRPAIGARDRSRQSEAPTGYSGNRTFGVIAGRDADIAEVAIEIIGQSREDRWVIGQVSIEPGDIFARRNGLTGVESRGEAARIQPVKSS